MTTHTDTGSGDSEKATNDNPASPELRLRFGIESLPHLHKGHGRAACPHCDCEDALASIQANLREAIDERDKWRAAFQSKQLYPISEMEQELAAVEVQRAEATERAEKAEPFIAMWERCNDVANQQIRRADESTAKLAVAVEALKATEAECRCGQRVEHTDEFGNPDSGTMMGCSASVIARTAL